MKISIKTVSRLTAIVLVVIAGGVFGNFTVSAAPNEQAVLTATKAGAPRTAVIKELTDLPSDVLTRPTAGAPEGQAYIGQVLQVGGTVRTLGRGNARIDLSDGTIIRVSPKSMFTITALDPVSPITRLTLLLGKVWVTLTGGTMNVETPVGVAAVRGSYMGVGYNSELLQLILSCLETSQACVFTTPDGQTYTVGSLDLIDFTPGPPPVLRIRKMIGVDVKDWLIVIPGNQLITVIPATHTPEPRPEPPSGSQ